MNENFSMEQEALERMEYAIPPRYRRMGLAQWVRAMFVGVLVAVALPWLLIGYKHGYYFSSLPNFERYDQADERKAAFIRYMLPLVYQANGDIRKQQRKMLVIYSNYANGKSLDSVDVRWVTDLAQRYKVENFALDGSLTAQEQQQAWVSLFRRVDTIPVSLVLAQAANESAWGTSRFAREGYNLFGEWCFTEGCGIKPRQREEGATHEVRAFGSVYASVQSYMHNLNTNKAYGDFRHLRVSLRREGSLLDGFHLAGGLTRYSSEGTRYVEAIRSMIRENGLGQFDGIQSAQEKDDSKLSS